MTKFYLCSDHFSPDCFSNPEVEDQSFLRLNRVFSIPIPSIFEDNLMKNARLVTENREMFVNYARHSKNDPEFRKIVLHKTNERDFKEEIFEADQNIEVTLPNQEESVVEEEEIIETSKADECEPIIITDYCRLCASSIAVLVPIFDENGEFTEDAECLNVMPSGLIQMNDNLPQSACNECLEKLQFCSNIINGFVYNQSLFVSE